MYSIHLYDELRQRVGIYSLNSIDDKEALDHARLVADACRDRCETYKVLKYASVIANRRVPPPLPLETAAHVIFRQQVNAVETEERIHDSQYPVAASQRLARRMEELKAIQAALRSAAPA